MADFASNPNNRLDLLRDPIFEWTVARAAEKIIDAVASPALRLRILMRRPDLVTERAIADLSGEDLARLFEACGTDDASRTVVDVAVHRDLGPASADILTRASLDEQLKSIARIVNVAAISPEKTSQRLDRAARGIPDRGIYPSGSDYGIRRRLAQQYLDVIPRLAAPARLRGPEGKLHPHRGHCCDHTAAIAVSIGSACAPAFKKAVRRA